MKRINFFVMLLVEFLIKGIVFPDIKIGITRKGLSFFYQNTNLSNNY